ncbi:MAG: hypothetical protein IT319_04670 [Anaerolineae bacterium]|nr:hypothetical protein [Anaerolineae bacterium]
MRLRFIAVMAAAFIVMYVGYQHLAAQNVVTCPGLVQRAIDSVGNNCGGLDRNSACYGFNDVEAAFSVAQPVSFFTAPSDRARLLELESLSTSPMIEEQEKWGIALLSVQANLPDTLPGQSVIFMLMGDTQVENAVPEDNTFQTGATVNVSLSIGADLYYEPGLGGQVVGSIPQGTALTADAVSDDGQWVRVVYRGTPGWITRQVLTADGDLGALPVIGADTKTPMQAFYFRTSISGTECTEAPNALVVQGPQNLMVDININGADVRLGSTVAFYLLPVDPATLQYLVSLYGEIGAITRLMQVLVIDGHVVLNPGTDEEMELNTGEMTFICLTDPENLGADGQDNDRTVFADCPWAPPRPVTVEDLERFREIEGVTLNYPIDLPLLLPTVTPTFTNTPRPFVPFVPTATPIPPAAPTDTPQPGLPPPQEPPPQPTPTNTPACPTVPTSAPDVASLIDAINLANQCPDANTIDLAGEGSYTFLSVDNTTDGPNALPSVTSPITINGSHASFNNDASLRYFHVGGGGNLTISNLWMYGGSVTGANGGAVYNAGALSLSNVAIQNSYADNGGGIYNAGTLSIFGASISNNNEGGNGAAQNGGGLYNAGTATIDKTTFAYNGAGNLGGGIYNAGTLSLLNSTVSQNGAAAGGFGIYNAGSTTMNFTTVYGNYFSGGVKIDNRVDAGLSGRYAKRVALGQSGDFAAVVVVSGTVTAKNSIIGGSIPNCSGTISAVGTGNFSDDSTCIGFTPVQDVGVIGLNELGIDSPAVDGIGVDCTTSGGATVTDDQYYTPRPQDNTGSGMGTCDAGSFEVQSQF